MFAHIMDALAAKGKTWQKNTVIMLLSRLKDKGYLRAKKIGRRNEYIPLVSNLIQSDLLTGEEYRELKKLLDGGR